jgi:conjugal transfer pilus assembly protein TrbC
VWATDFLRAAACAAASASAALAFAQPVITDEDIRRARERNPMPSDEEVRRTQTQPAPRIDKLPLPPHRVPLDLEALSRGFDAQVPGSALQPPSGPSLLVFISFAMPELTLQRLVEQASRARATLILRGLLDGSLTRTAVRIQSLLGTRRAAVQIDPQAFDRYSVTRTPSFVLTRGGSSEATCTEGVCASATGYVIVAGDVSLHYALRQMQRGAPRFANDASAFLTQLER